MRCPRPDIINRLRAAITGRKFPRELYISKVAEVFQEPKWIIELAFLDMLKEGVVSVNHYKNSTYRFWKKGDGHDCDYISLYSAIEYKSKKVRVCKTCSQPVSKRHEKSKHHDKHKCMENTVKHILES